MTRGVSLSFYTVIWLIAVVSAGSAQTPESGLLRDGRLLYQAYCARCHGDDGGDTTSYWGAASLVDITQRHTPQWILNQSTSFVGRSFEGREGEALVTYLDTFRSGGTASLQAPAQDMPEEYRAALAYLGKTGDYQDHVLKINIPRNDLAVTVAGVATPTPFGFGGWLAMTKGDNGREVMMGDLVLLQEEVNPVMSALLDHGLDVTALHNHFFWEEPRIFYMHVHGHGAAADLARSVRPALDLIGAGTPRSAGAANTPQSAGRLNTARLAQIIGHEGAQNGAVYKITIGRPDLNVKEMGATINARMGLNTWASFVGTDENAAVAGDVAMLENEVTPVLKALRSHDLDVVAIHHHMTGVQPMIVFLHYWGTGSAEKLAIGFKAALDELGKGTGR